MRFIRRYWDIIGGILAGAAITAVAQFQLDVVQLCYSIIILMIVCIGIFRIIKQEADKRRHNERGHTVVDAIVDGQKPIKALNIAQEPTREGEKLGKKIIEIWGVIKPAMEKIKTFFSKFKGYILTTALAILTVVEMCGGFINTACGGVLTINGIEVLPVVTLACTAVVGIISNGYTAEQKEKIKALFSKSNTNELVKTEIKKTVKEKSAQLTTFNKLLATKQHELANLESALEALRAKAQAKSEMEAMKPPLATAEDVRLANSEVVAGEAKVEDKKGEIASTKASIDELTRTIGALRSQL
jgi:hypothetical protein